MTTWSQDFAYWIVEYFSPAICIILILFTNPESVSMV